jgi:hypothetical protein
MRGRGIARGREMLFIDLSFMSRLYVVATSTWFIACGSKVFYVFVAGFSPYGRKTGNKKITGQR